MSRRAYPAAKRALDVTVSALLLTAAAPAMGVIALAVLRDLGAPVLFRQSRPGRDGKPFELVKFRTMRPPDGRTGDVARMTVLGRWLRSTSLDELPTLWNVLRGDMSLVGPRPLLTEYLPRFTPVQARRHEVRPGITGLAQIRGRNGLSWEEKFAADVEYVDHMCFTLDVRILAATIGTVLSRRGVVASESETMPEFLGTTGPGGHP